MPTDRFFKRACHRNMKEFDPKKKHFGVLNPGSGVRSVGTSGVHIRGKAGAYAGRER